VLTLDRQGQIELVRNMEETLAAMRAVEAESAKRMAKTGEKPIRARMGISAFKLPPGPAE
jgi:nicotinamide mononucleotide (NMN) deamidase PncC